MMARQKLPLTRRITIIVLFSIAVFISKVFFPPPLDKAMIFVQSLFYALANLTIGRLGATITGSVSGLITQLWRPVFIPFTFLFAVVYGMMVDGFIYLFKARPSSRYLSKWRIMIALSLASVTTGMSSMYVTVAVGMMPGAYQIYLMIIVMGTLSGLFAGYLTSLIWNKYLSKR